MIVGRGGIALLLILAGTAQAGQPPADAPLTRENVRTLPPAEVARRALGRLAGQVRAVEVPDMSRLGDHPLDEVILRFQREAIAPGLCSEAFLSISFATVDPARTLAPHPETAPARPIRYSAGEGLRIIGPLSRDPIADQAEADRACLAGNMDDPYFSTDGVGSLDPPLGAVERALIELRGESEGRAMIGRLVHVGWGICESREPRCIRVTARIPLNRGSIYYRALSIDDVRYDRMNRLVSIGKAELVDSATIP